MYSENKGIEERRLGLSKLERSIRELIRKQQKITMDYFSDNIKEILKGINALGACLSDNKFEREIEKNCIELKNLKEKL